jgi:hypothetical protein
MKIQVVDNSNKIITGYDPVVFSKIDEYFASIPNNSCEFILANEVFDYVESAEIPMVVQKLLLKLRIGGKMVLGGKDINMFCKSVKNGLISEQDASNIIANTKSLVSYQVVENIVAQLGLKYTTQLNGVSYEVVATR